ncbi:MAG: copper amine oxidase N-terminal domain-containing protein [Clostridia bacterium]|nr:copper amine oxidase N-terminal domain-containing protein [Clostridia bacterium]
MKKYLGIFLAAILCVMLAVAASAADVYVNDGGTGDGSAADKPLGNMTEAINKIATDGGKVIIVDTYTCAEEYYEPEHVGNIVITGGKYVFSHGKYNRWFLSGPGSTTFENITFSYAAGTTHLIVARYNKLIMGEGIIDAGTKAYIVGGYQLPLDDAAVFDKDSDVTIKSGNYYLIAGHSRSAGDYEFTGTSHITVEGGEIGSVYGACVNGNYGGHGEINIKGGNITNVYTGGDGTRRLNGNCVVNITGGTIGGLVLNNVMGKTTVNFSGGAVGNASKSVEAAIAEFVVDGTATLYATPNVDAKIISLFFDKVNYVDEIPTGPAVELKMTLGKTTYTLNGETKTMDVAPIIRNERTMLPVRYVAEALGAEIAWDGATSTATLKTADTEIKITVGAANATVNGKSVALDSPAFIENDRTYMPVRFVAETLGGTVAWDGATSTATITK